MLSHVKRKVNYTTKSQLFITPLIVIIYPLFPIFSFFLISILSLYCLMANGKKFGYNASKVNLLFIILLFLFSMLLFASFQGYYNYFLDDFQKRVSLQHYLYWVFALPISFYFAHFWHLIYATSNGVKFFILVVTKFFSAFAFVYVYGMRADQAFSIYTLVATNTFAFILAAEMSDHISISRRRLFVFLIGFTFFLLSSSSQSSGLAILMMLASALRSRLFAAGIFTLLALISFNIYLVSSELTVWHFDQNIALRWELYRNAIMIFKETYGQGVGFGPSVVPTHYNSREANAFIWFDPLTNDRFSIGSHSMFFEAIARFGALGILFSLMIVVGLVYLLSSSRESISAFVAFAAALLIAFFNMSLFSINFSLAFYLCCGFLIFKSSSLNAQRL